VRSWTNSSDNHFIRSSCVNHLNLDIVGIAETHLMKNNVICMDGYRWFGQNRKALHVRAKTGSGGIGILVTETLFSAFDINVVEDNYEGIMWLQFKERSSGDVFYCCVCYLPPIESTRDVDVHEFLYSLLCDIH
jgi:hypothetical protein